MKTSSISVVLVFRCVFVIHFHITLKTKSVILQPFGRSSFDRNLAAFAIVHLRVCYILQVAIFLLIF